MQRLDKLLVERNIVTTRAQAQKLIEADLVEVRVVGIWQIHNKPAAKCDDRCEIRVGEHPELRYVSRAGLKLEAALIACGIAVKDFVALDVGQSTGGFTDCLLQHGAAKVVGVDVGRDQLVPALRDDARVVCLEGLNARHLSVDDLAHTETAFDIVVMDVSFISQTLILPNLPALLKPQGLLMTLIKPQFELGPEALNKGGIVKDLQKVAALEPKFKNLIEDLGFEVLNYLPSPIEGGDGNAEFLMVARLVGG